MNYCFPFCEVFRHLPKLRSWRESQFLYFPGVMLFLFILSEQSSLSKRNKMLFQLKRPAWKFPFLISMHHCGFAIWLTRMISVVVKRFLHKFYDFRVCFFTFLLFLLVVLLCLWQFSWTVNSGNNWEGVTKICQISHPLCNICYLFPISFGKVRVYYEVFQLLNLCVAWTEKYPAILFWL